MNFLSTHLDVILLALAALIMLALLALVFLAARRDGGKGGAASAKALRLLGAAAVRRSFRRAVKLIERNLATRAERYNLSWTMLLNESAGAPLPLHASGLQSALSEEAGMRAAAQGLDWQFFDHGVVIQLRSAYLGGADVDGVWDDLIGHCRKYRPQRPLDCIVLAIPAAQLLDLGPDGQLQLLARAKSLHRRLWLAQNRLALRFPVHVVVSECETIPGFASFAAALPDATQRSILGWASPHELVAPYRAQWIDSAIDQVGGAIADSCAELSALESGDSDSSAYFLLASEVERLRPGLSLFCDELMRPSAYHESFLLRGVYLTGDCGDAAVLRAASGAVAIAGQEPPAVPTESQHAMPAFLRDIFERKIFAEVGLVRSSAQRMRQPALKRVGWALLFLVPLLWATGLAFATVRLVGQGKQLVAILQSEEGAGGLGFGTRDTAIAALENFAGLGGARFGSDFMPGSWLPFEHLQDRLDSRLQKHFANAAVPALHDAALSKLASLTGTVHFNGSGDPQLFDPASCALAAPTVIVPSNTLNPAMLPEFAALNDYLKSLLPLALAINSVERLEQAAPATVGASVPAAKGDDLALAVKLLLDHRLADRPDRRGALDRAAALYRQAALSKSGRRTPMPPPEALQQAARCALQQLGGSLYARLFDHNPLLETQRTIATHVASLQGGVKAGAGLDGQLALWRNLRGALDAQQDLLSPGQGEWMVQRPMQLGAAYTDLLKRIGENTLLGQAARDDFAALAERGHARFTQAWAADMNAGGQSDSALPLAWSAETKSWTATPERKALRSAVAALLAQPYVRSSAPASYPVVAPGAAIVWDKGQLERVSSLIESRKAFRAGPLIDLPANLQQPAGALVDLALLSAAHAALAQGMRVVDAELPGKATDADRLRVLELRAWMESIGARGELAPLDAALTVDAVTRLHRLDQLLLAAQLYVPRDAAFDNWTGKAGPLLDAFGGGDGTGVLAYVEQQKGFIDAVARQADGVLQFLLSAGVETPLVNRWQRQAADLQLYNRKSPLSSRLALESFIVEDSATIDVANCADKLAGRKASVGTDIYAAQLQGLKTALLARCRALAGGASESRWQTFAIAYNSNLGRRAPFVAAGTGAVFDAMPAERDAVAATLRNYDLAHAATTQAARDRGQSGPRAEVKAADQEFARVRDLLAPLFPADDSQPAALDLSIDFRVNRSAEQRANAIIDWSLSVGPATLRHGDPARALRWEPGMPVVLSLRLARDGLLAPDPGADARRPNMTVVERAVSFRFDDPWALFTFVQTFRVADPAGDDGRALLLRVEFPVVAAGTAVPPASPSTVQLFLRARVRAPGKQTTLPWPAAFPEQLPLWHQPAKNPT
jgi:type VI secretion system protein ImpL